MKFAQVYRYAEKEPKDPFQSEKEKKAYCEAQAQQKKLNVQNAINDRRGQITGAFEKAQVMISRAPNIQQFAIGGVTGLVTGFVTSKVGKTVAIIGGGTVLLCVGANQAGLININWEKFGKKMEQTSSKIESKVPSIKGNIGKFGRANTYFAAGFVGGFLLGLAS